MAHPKQCAIFLPAMKRCLSVLLLLLLALVANGTERVKFKISKPFAVINFMRAAGNEAHISSTLVSYVRSNISAQDSGTFFGAVRRFNSINMENSLVFQEYPECRQKPKTIAGLINCAAIQSATIEEFFERTFGLLPNEQWLKMKKAILTAVPFYDRILGMYDDALEGQLHALEEYTTQTDKVFYKLKTFYGSTWGNDIPFTISIFAIPGNKGNTTASPYGNSLALGVLTGETEHEIRMGVAIHEMCHVLYEEQPLKKQWEIDSAFAQSKSAHAPYAYTYFDEALATACGNGWAYAQLAGNEDVGDWYNDEYINKYAKALYPIVKKYIDEGKRIDRAFVKKAIAAFEKTFPNAIYEYANLLNRVNLYTDAENHERFSEVYSCIARHIRITSSNGSYPITDAACMEPIQQSKGTQFFVIYTNHVANYELLKKVYPEIERLDPRDEGIASFFDRKKRPVVILNASSLKNLEKAAIQLVDDKKIATGRLFAPLR